MAHTYHAHVTKPQTQIATACRRPNLTYLRVVQHAALLGPVDLAHRVEKQRARQTCDSNKTTHTPTTTT